MSVVFSQKSLEEVYDIIPRAELILELKNLIIEEDRYQITENKMEEELYFKFNGYQLITYTSPLSVKIRAEKQHIIRLIGDVLGQYSRRSNGFVIEHIIPHFAEFVSSESDLTTKVYFSQYGKTWGLKYV